MWTLINKVKPAPQLATGPQLTFTVKGRAQPGAEPVSEVKAPATAPRMGKVKA